MRRFMHTFVFTCALALTSLTHAATTAPAPATTTATTTATATLKENDFLAICGDSITEQKLYSLYIEDYLLMCKPVSNVRAMQFGWGGERAPGFLGRMSNVLRFPVTAATTCYGMNDGGYGPLTPENAKMYRDGMTGIVDTFQKSGVRLIVVGSPGAVDSKTYRPTPNANEDKVYNKTLAELGDIARQVAAEQKVGFADVHGVMLDVMAKAKAKYGEDYPVAGGDGVHPGANGHLVMAYAFLKALGADGNIGTITVDLAANKAEATDGHKVLSSNAGAIEIESTRYPFCFSGDPKDPNATSGIIEFFPFNQDLNRYLLVVKNPGEGVAKLKVTWGATSKEYDAAALAKGVNLAADFLTNPFSEPFKKVEEAVRNQQNYETPLIKELLQRWPEFVKLLPDQKPQFDQIASAAIEKAKSLNDAAVAAVTPVKHTIKIEKVTAPAPAAVPAPAPPAK
jgi:lysophospholipase L1-like esterase